MDQLQGSVGAPGCPRSRRRKGTEVLGSRGPWAVALDSRGLSSARGLMFFPPPPFILYIFFSLL